MSMLRYLSGQRNGELSTRLYSLHIAYRSKVCIRLEWFLLAKTVLLNVAITLRNAHTFIYVCAALLAIVNITNVQS